MNNFGINEDMPITPGDNNWTRKRVTTREWDEPNYQKLKRYERDERLKRDEERSGYKRPFEIEEQDEPGKRMVKDTPKYTYRFNVWVENEFELEDVFQEIQEILNINEVIYGGAKMNLGLRPYVGVEMLSMEGLALLFDETRKLTNKYKLELSGKDENGNDVLMM